MFYVDQITHYTYEEKRSKFIAYLLPYSQFDTLMLQLKEEHPKARHFVYAYRYLNTFDQIVENQSDDGEPKNSSGKPTLGALRGCDLINSAVIVVRYFGGIKLGVGGLVRAYSKSVLLVCDGSDLLTFVKQATYTHSCSYSDLGRVEHLLKTSGATYEKEFGIDQVTCRLSIDEKHLDHLIDALNK
jgi:uncharacterized YigZ family protein